MKFQLIKLNGNVLISLKRAVPPFLFEKNYKSKKHYLQKVIIVVRKEILSIFSIHPRQILSY